MTIVIVDLDVLSDNRHRAYLAGGDTWDQYHAAACRDPLDAQAAILVMGLHRMGAEVYAISDRPHDSRVTVEWIMRHQLPIVECYGRAPGLTRPANEVKSGLLTGFPIKPDFVIAEDDRIAETARGLGAYVIQVSRPA